MNATGVLEAERRNRKAGVGVAGWMMLCTADDGVTCVDGYVAVTLRIRLLMMYRLFRKLLSFFLPVHAESGG